MVRTGLSRATKHKETIEIDDLQLISTYLFKDINDPILLRQSMWYCLAVHFASRGLEFHHQLNLNSFDFKVDSDGDEYVLIKHETQQKTFSVASPERRLRRTNSCMLAEQIPALLRLYAYLSTKLIQMPNLSLTVVLKIYAPKILSGTQINL
jgi:hypothetical protein